MPRWSLNRSFIGTCPGRYLLERILTLSKTKRGVDAGEILRKTKKKTNVQERVKPGRFGTLTTAAAAAFWVAIILARYLFNICYLFVSELYTQVRRRSGGE